MTNFTSAITYDDGCNKLPKINKIASPEFKQEWIAALRSGKYEQGQANLHSGNKFCCLGVACDLLKEMLNLKIDSFIEPEGKVEIISYNNETSQLPPQVAEYIFGNRHNVLGNLKTSTETGIETINLAELNDVAKYSFNEIADVIEKKF